MQQNKIGIALFTFNRFDLFEQTIVSLNNNFLSDEFDLCVFSDGPKSEQDIGDIKKIRDYVSNFKGFKTIKLVSKDENLGLFNSILQGINILLKDYESVIILEDDLITNRYFLKYMSDALNYYKNDDRICQISGYSYFNEFYKSKKYNLDKTFVIRGADCLGWATWQDRWNYFDQDHVINEIKKLKNPIYKYRFNKNGSYPFSKLLSRQKLKKDSWAVLWYSYNFNLNKNTIYPHQSFVKHIGNDKRSTNYNTESISDPLSVYFNKVEYIDYDFNSVNTVYRSEIFYRKFLKRFKLDLINRVKTYIQLKFNIS